MLEVALLLARYVFLGLLYLFLFVVYRGMVRELRERRGSGKWKMENGKRKTENGPPDHGAPPISNLQFPTSNFQPPLAAAERRLRLVVRESGDGRLSPGTFYFVEGSLTFGRAPDNTIVLSDRFASGHHARLTQQTGGELWLEDLGSTNGTRLNERDIQGAVPVKIGDEIGIGTVRFRVEEG